MKKSCRYPIRRRQPVDHGYLFVTDEGLPMTPQDVIDAGVRAMTASGFPPAHIYAFQRNGFMISESNVGAWKPQERASWRAALAEYAQLHPDAPPVPELCRWPSAN